MPLVQNPLIGQASGTLGDVIFQYYKGRNVIRSKPMNPHDPATIDQLAQRDKLRQGVKIFFTAPDKIHYGWIESPETIRPYNNFLSHFMLKACTSVGDHAQIDIPKVRPSKGSFKQTGIFDYWTDEGLMGSIIYFEPGETHEGRSPNDIAQAARYSYMRKEWIFASEHRTRSDGFIQIEAPYPNEGGEPFELFLWFLTPDRKKSSTSLSVTATAS